jgi:serine/threonine protein kinase
MGEVYRARDTRLDRDVAIKVLPEEFAGDDQRLARFDREAKVLASLNHPNIAGIYGIEELDGAKALVLELVEGLTLAGCSGVPAQLWDASSVGRCVSHACTSSIRQTQLPAGQASAAEPQSTATFERPKTCP